MANPRSAWGIDVGNRALKAIKLVRDPAGTLRVDDFEIIEHETPLSTAGDNRDSLIQSAVANFVQKHPAKGATTAVSVSGSSSLARFIKLPPVEPKKIPEIVRFEAIQQIPFPLDDVEWSYQLFQSPDSPDVEVGIFAMRKELVNHHMKFFTDVGLNVEVVQLNPLAVYNAMAYDDRLKGATMMIDLGSENTDLIIADGESIWLRSIPIGGKNFTEILVKQFKLPFPKAEELKRSAATSKYAKQIFQAMRPVFADLVAEVQRSIGFYASVHRESRIKKVMALGGTFRLPGLQKYLQQNLQLEVARIDNLSAGGPADAKTRTVFDENLLSLTSAYGLAIQAMGDGKINSSLLPEHIRREKLWKDKTPWFAAAAAAFVIGTGVAMGSYFVQNVQYTQNQGYRDHAQAALIAGTALDSEWKSKVEQNGQADHQRITNIRSMLYYREVWPDLVEKIYGALPTPTDPALRAGDWTTVKASLPRKKRDLILIDDINSVYNGDLAKASLPGGEGVQSVGAFSSLPKMQPNTIPVGSHGFVITIDLITPYGAAVVPALTFVNDTFIKNMHNLQTATMPPGQQYSIVYAEVTRQRKLGDDEANVAKIRTRDDHWEAAKLVNNPPAAHAPGQVTPPPPSGSAFGPVVLPGGAAPAVPGLIDPNTGEDMSFDTTFTVTAIVIVPDPDAGKQSAGATAASGAPGAPGMPVGPAR